MVCEFSKNFLRNLPRKVDDTASPILVPNKDWEQWVISGNSTDDQDLYFFGYGHEYRDGKRCFGGTSNLNFYSTIRLCQGSWGCSSST